MVKFLTQEWLDENVQMAQSFPERPGASARMQYHVNGAPGGDAKFYWLVEDGKLTEAKMGEDPGAEFTMIVGYEDFKAVNQGTLDAQAAFMQGKMKVTGNMGKLMSLMPLTMSPEYKDIQARMLEVTEF
jgi:putative sterol carrier protein